MPKVAPGTAETNGSESLARRADGRAVVPEVNEHGKHTAQKLKECEKREAAGQLLAELAKGVESVRSEGGLTVGEAFADPER